METARNGHSQNGEDRSRKAVKSSPPRGVAPIVRASRIVFIDDATAPDRVGRRRFTHPRRATAVEEDVAIDALEAASLGADSSDACVVLCVPDGAVAASREQARAVWGRNEGADAERALLIEHGGVSLEWRPGLALVQGRDDARNDVVAALVDFAFYEGALRALERDVESAELASEADVALAHRVRYRDRARWARLTACAEKCTRMRLAFARLEPRLGAPASTLSPGARSWMSRLIQKSEVEDRLEAVSDRLEALEELYEGATQRVSEYRWYVVGHALEIGIIVILLFECALMSTDIYLHVRDRPIPTGDTSVTESAERHASAEVGVGRP
jgi:hypothetical protein